MTCHNHRGECLAGKCLLKAATTCCLRGKHELTEEEQGEVKEGRLLPAAPPISGKQEGSRRCNMCSFIFVFCLWT